MNITHSRLILASAISLTLAACGGGGGGGGGGAGSSSGTVIDGYLEGATVVCDTNGNDALDTGEATTFTLDDGSFSFSPRCTSAVFAFGGINRVSDTVAYPFTGILKAPVGSSVVTPLTTLLALNPALSESDLVELLGLPEGTDLRNTDPVELAEGGDITLLQKTLAVQELLQEATAVFSAAPGDNTTFLLVAEQLATKLQEAAAAPSPTPLFDNTGAVDSTLLEDVITTINDSGDVDPIDPADITDMVNGIVALSESLLATTSLDNLTTLAETTQDPENEPVVTPPAQANYVALKSDTLKVNNHNVKLTAADPFRNAGLAFTGPIDTLNFDFDIEGFPTIDQDVAIGLRMTDANRVLELAFTGVRFNLNGSLTVNLTNAKGYLYAKTASGDNFNVVLNTVNSNLISMDAGNVLTIDYSNLLAALKTVATNAQDADIDMLADMTGTFDTTFVVNNLNLRLTDTSAYPVASVTVSNQPEAQVTGYGVSGKLIIN